MSPVGQLVEVCDPQIVSSPTMPPYKTDSTLRRGTACLSCRKRKLKCDGIRPICRQCTKMNRGHTCEYDDQQQKSRTQLLKEQLSSLERRLQELESSSSRGSSSSPIFDLELETYGLEVFDDVPGGSNDYAPFNDFGSPASSSPGSAPQSKLFDPENSILDASGSGSSSTIETAHWDPRSSIPTEAKKYLLEVFMAHRHQCWFYGSMERFLETPQQFGSEPHPALINAMYLLACHYAQSPYYSEMEPAFFVQAQHEINGALDSSDRLTDIVQASSLLAIYLYTNNRVMEGYRHTFSAIRLAVGLGLNQIRSSNAAAPGCPQQAPLIPISPPRNNTELKDRIFAFWQIFMVDRCWSVANKLPLALPDKDSSHCRILTPWPSILEGAQWEEHGLHPPLQTLFEGPDLKDTTALYLPAMKAKAAALYELTHRSKNVDTSDWRYVFAESAVQRFSSTIPSMPLGRDCIVVQTMMYTSFIHLRRPGLFDQRAFKAANSIIRLLRQLSEEDYQYLDPILGVCWASASEVFIRTLVSAGQMGNIYGDIASIVKTSNTCLDTLASALKTLSAFSPVSSDLALKVELSRVQSIRI